MIRSVTWHQDEKQTLIIVGQNRWHSIASQPYCNFEFIRDAFNNDPTIYNGFCEEVVMIGIADSDHYFCFGLDYKYRKLKRYGPGL